MSSSHYDRDRQLQQSNVPSTTPAEIPRRVGTSRTHIREIHKNAWLKYFCQKEHEKKGTPFIKKYYEKHWVVFCVHDDIEPILEFYTDPKVAVTHKPSLSVPLNNCLHVSSSIIGQDNEYEFAVAFPTQVVRLVAANWEQMSEWVESLTGKLREMNILSPKDNLYSKMPEIQSSCSNSVQGTAHNFLSNRFPNTTRDPNSPLPPPPNGCISPVLGTEFERQFSSSIIRGQELVVTEHQTTLRIPVTDASASGSSISSSSGAASCIIPTSTQQIITVPGHQTSNSETGAGARVNLSHVQNLLVDTTSPVNSVCLQPNNVFTTISQSSNPETALIVISNCENLVNLTVGEDVVTQANNDVTSSSSQPIVVNNPNVSNTVQVNFDDSNAIGQQQRPSSTILIQNENSSHPISSSFVTKCQIPSTSSLLSSHIVQPVHKQLSSSLQQSAAQPTTKLNNSRAAQQCPTSSSSSNSSHHQDPTSSGLERQHSAPCQVQRSNSQENMYEHLFIPNGVVLSSAATSVTALKTSCPVSSSKDAKNNNNISVPQQQEEDSTPPLIPRRNQNPKKVARSSPGQQRSSSLNRLQQGSVVVSNHMNSSRSREHRGNGEPSTSSTHHNHRHCARLVDVIRPFETETYPLEAAAHSSSSHVEANRPMDAMIGFRKGEYRIRRDDCHHNNGSERPATSRTTNGASHVPLKEQQVMRLKAEINNAAGGVRIVLRKKDCIDSIAFVDYLGAVWIAGWKQSLFPVLYYAFHVGDQILKVAGVTVHNSAEAYRAIKMASSMQVEFIIRRLPYGKVLVLKRKNGESLGLISTGNSGEVEVEPDGLASCHGLPLCGPSAADSQSTCNWFLTEINNRPLSLFAQKHEIKERLNPVGNEASILVQPADLVRQLRKQLKCIKNFKEYLVI